MATTEWEVMDPVAFRESGLLYMVNRAVLWPLGIALRLNAETGEMHGFIDIIMLVEPETIVEGTIDVKREPGGCHPAERFARFAAYRVDEMPTEMEREMAAKAMRRIVPGFAISPLRDVPEGVPSRDPDGTQEGS